MAGGDEIATKKRSGGATITRALQLKNSYEFIVPGRSPYRLESMKTVMWPQYTMRSEGWGCVMGDCILDGKRYEKDQSPTIVKRGVK
ncbi:MAG: hypothetical protein JXA20_15655 [Spirochaetes bacterium]|nr:hypothetical protein [Spirochaetota bacterium]